MGEDSGNSVTLPRDRNNRALHERRSSKRSPRVLKLRQIEWYDMDPLLRDKLAALRPLDTANGASSTTICKICGGRSVLFDSVDFNKYCDPDNFHGYGMAGIGVPYYRCEACEFLFTKFFDDWSEREFSEFVYNSDYIKVDGAYAVDRPVANAEKFASVFAGLEHISFLDYGGGSGIYTDELKKRGFGRVATFDPFSQPTRPDGLFDVISAFEVIEHSPTPLSTFADMRAFLADGGCIFFSQALQPSNIKSIRGNWWYVAPRNGHVSTYSMTTLLEIARKMGWECYRCDEYTFAFAPENASEAAKRALEALGAFRTAISMLYPSTAPDQSQWHGREEYQGRGFHWSGEREISWDNQLIVKGANEFHLNVLMECRANFGANCEMFLNGAQLETKFEGNRIVARHVSNSTMLGRVSLKTPPLTIPRETGANDDPRALGLAVFDLQTE